ncbi:hypothetical protein [Microbacterium rhizomatis]|uniref:hypothetical protein n=1 Tax=Microbacterium rhizomatis TaxID=1631477 RepID=UPI0014790518|nr:hypothetical protein [Microbacterium rhizomatis]
MSGSTPPPSPAEGSPSGDSPAGSRRDPSEWLGLARPVSSAVAQTQRLLLQHILQRQKH